MTAWRLNMQYNRVEVYICGKRYVLQTSDDPEYIKELARQLDKKLNDIFNVDDTISLVDASILVAMEIMDESLKNTSSIDNIRAQVKTYVEEAAQARAETEQYKKRIAQLEQVIEKQKTELEIYSLRDHIEKKSNEPKNNYPVNNRR